MRPVTKTIIGCRWIGPGGIPPVVVMVGGDPIPTSIVVDQGLMVPGDTGVVTGQDGILAGNAHGPDLVSPDKGQVRFYPGHVGWLSVGSGFLQLINLISCNASHV